MYISQKNKHKIIRGPKETEFVLKLYLLMKLKKIKLKYVVEQMRSRGFKKFNRQFFINYFLLNLHFINFTTLCTIIDILNTTLSEVEAVNIPEEFRRKYIK